MGVAGTGQSRPDILRNPADAEKEKLTFYGKRPS
jgi:hypothetical protein